MGTGYEQCGVDDIRVALVSAGMSEIDVRALKGKGALAFEAKQRGLTPEQILGSAPPVENYDGVIDAKILDDDEVDLQIREALESAQLEDDSPEEKKAVPEVEIPVRGDIGWHEYVLSLFSDKELDKGYPKANGLRRVAHVLYGEFVFSGVKDFQIFPGTNHNDPGRAACLYEIVVGSLPNETTTYRGMGSSYIGNTDNDFAVYPEAIAETRAEVRALRKLLGIEIHAAEEVTSKDTAAVISDYIQTATQSTPTSGEWSAMDPISEAQKTHITTKCKVLGVDINKIAPALDTYTRKDALTLMDELGQFQRKVKEIPVEVKL